LLISDVLLVAHVTRRRVLNEVQACFRWRRQ